MKTHEDRIGQLLRKMTLAEKIGQMTQITIGALGKGGELTDGQGPFEFDPRALDTYLSRYKIGSVLNVPGHAVSVEKWEYIVSTLQQRAMSEIGIPLVYGIDSMHGANYTLGATLFPHSVAIGATFDRRMARRGAEVAAYETRASGIPWNFAPVVDLGRDPRWSRMWETYGEDAYLVAEMGAQAVKGYQGGDREHIGHRSVGACLKHFVGYGVPRSGRDRTPAVIPWHELREKHFEPFLEALRAGALSVMVNSGMVNGIPVHCNRTLLTGWLKEETGWDGVVVTDWSDIDNLWRRDRVAAGAKEAVCLAINAGIDMAMVPYDPSFCDSLRESVEEGRVSRERIDDAVRRILRLKCRLGLFDRPWIAPALYPEFASEQFRRISYDAAVESMTLLKNDGALLPLKRGAKLLVCGPNADSVRAMHGGWSYSWQGDRAERLATGTVTFLKALRAKFGSECVVYQPGVIYRNEFDYAKEEVVGVSAAIERAREADCIVLFLGENSYCETPGNLDDLTLSEPQTRLAEALSAAGKPIVLVLNEGRPRLVARIEPLAAAVVQTFLPGPMGGIALADILSGDVNPCGKLPYTYPRYPNNLSTYDHKYAESMDKVPGAYDYDATLCPQWEFGTGMSYTTFAYSGLKVDKTLFGPDDTLNIRVDVTNTGAVGGKEAVLLYIGDAVASVAPDVRRLREFTKFALEPGQTRTVVFEVPASRLAFVGEDGCPMLEEGDFNVEIGGLRSVVTCRVTHKWPPPAPSGI